MIAVQGSQVLTLRGMGASVAWVVWPEVVLRQRGGRASVYFSLLIVLSSPEMTCRTFRIFFSSVSRVGKGRRSPRRNGGIGLFIWK